MDKTYQVGNTVRLKCVFRDFDNIVRNPDIIKVKIYDQSYAQIGEFVLGSSNNTETGSYFYDYTIPLDSRGKLYYEWYSELQGSPSLKRGSFKVAFI